MSPTIVNGRALGVERNGVFNSHNTDPITGGKLWVDAAATWNAMRRAAIADGIPASDFVPAGPNSSARLLTAQQHFYAHQPPPAAYPGTSNHGWGIAVDVKTQRAVAWMLTHASKFGWSHDEGARVGEWWHWRYVGLSAAAFKRVTRKPDPLGHLTRQEKAWVKEYDALRRRADRYKSPNIRRRKALRAAMRAQMNEIRRVAVRSRNGWNVKNRLKRYRTLKSRAL